MKWMSEYWKHSIFTQIDVQFSNGHSHLNTRPVKKWHLDHFYKIYVYFFYLLYIKQTRLVSILQPVQFSNSQTRWLKTGQICPVNIQVMGWILDDFTSRQVIAIQILPDKSVRVFGHSLNSAKELYTQPSQWRMLKKVVSNKIEHFQRKQKNSYT
jgi:hypothetical protein